MGPRKKKKRKRCKVTESCSGSGGIPLNRWLYMYASSVPKLSQASKDQETTETNTSLILQTHSWVQLSFTNLATTSTMRTRVPSIMSHTLITVTKPNMIITHNKLNTQHGHQKAHGTVKFLNHGAHGSHTKHSEHHGSGAAHYILSTIHEKKESHGNLLRKVEHKRKDKPGKKKNSNEGRYSDDSGSGSDRD